MYYWKKNLRPRAYSLAASLAIMTLSLVISLSLSKKEAPVFFYILWEIAGDLMMNTARLLIIIPMLLSKYKPISYLL